MESPYYVNDDALSAAYWKSYHIRLESGIWLFRNTRDKIGTYNGEKLCWAKFCMLFVLQMFISILYSLS
jgi:hypothetical protein